ncbi:type III secretion system needle tip complex protein [Chromobacterium subtsugae]|uniref:Translocator protein BipB n=1 Tax=Chromobacterium subtsugae TaxID=251747 RepID=A0ABS7FGZ8_9NEIS|nr:MULTISPECIES: type III secretion system needle tip complex protein [Chromobacterium]KUM05622.1 pathogenicity island 1 effector protein SipB [Chromobacterium subtsugae]KZE88100.1 pathogenicity island 1 effector protein SipB [Chromobacterium sp. F49]MBW7565731.1 type III secretion system needle tip complex protein [Chromobacterium subtsugae]MBW8288564.1 type III secretion system needle tip complex protein [Chromobacterium subtsugae]WSE89827.1 type III secretion system needle tip complex prote
MSDAGTIGSAYLRNPGLAGAAFDSVRKDGSFLDAADKALKAVLATRAGEGKPTVSERDLATPALSQPSPKAQRELDGSGKLTLLLGQLMTLLGNVSLSQLESRLATWRAMMESQQAMGNQLSQEFQQAVAESQAATEAFRGAEGEYETAKAAADAAQQKAAAAKAKLEAMQPDDPGYAEAKAASQQAAAEAQLALQKAGQAGELAEKARLVAVDKAKRADELAGKVQGANVNTDAARKGAEDHLSNVGKLTMLMAMFSKLVGENSENSLKNDLALFEAMQEGRQKEMDKKSAEYQEEVRKAEELNRVMGCVGKILGALLTVVSVVAAAFTGGASLALAAVGVALMVADEVVKATTGVSFMEEALKPLMEKVLKPLMELIGKALSKALESMGVDKKTAEMVGAIAGAIIAAVAMVVVMVVVATVGKGAASKLGGALSKLMGDTIKKLVPKLLKELASNGGKLLSQGMQRLGNSLGLRTDELSKQLIRNTLNRVVVGGEVVNAASQAGGGVAQGVFMKNASEALADFSLARASMEQIEQWLKQAVEAFGSTQKITQELTAAMSAALQQNAEASRFVLRQSHA